MTASVLVVEDDTALREAMVETLRDSTPNVLSAADGASAVALLDSHEIGLVISDIQMQPTDGLQLLREIKRRHANIPAILVTGHGSIEDAVTAMQLGAKDYLLKPIVASDLKRLVDEYLPTAPVEQPVAGDQVTLDLLAVAQRVAKTDVTVTISGPSGSGKEVFAQFLHRESNRRDKPFVAINCAAIPETMLEAVLFGYEKGAFTGASSAHAGKFEQANRGTLLLDEVSEMDLGLQAKLLRVIQEREVERLGGREVIPLDVRVIATTNRDLKQFVADGKFREDLYYRLNVFPLYVPPLCDRRDDILPLARHIIKRLGSAGVELSATAADALLAHNWPGNVRELENLLQRSLILLAGKELSAADLSFEHAPNRTDMGGDLSDGLRNKEFRLISEALVQHAGKRTAVAEALGISPRSLRYKLARMRDAGLTIPGEKS